MIAGSLEIQMLANMARLADDMGKAKTMVGSSMKSIEGAVASAKSALGALGIGLGVGYFVTLIKGSIDAMDKLRDLSKTTNITVENLAGLQLAAKQSGGDLNSIADSINKLSMNMGKDSEKFRALGITAKEPLEAFKQLSDIFVKLEDPQQRAAVMAAALGRSWAGAAPLLSEGSAKIQEMVDKGTLLSGMTKEAAENADKFNDQMAELNTTLGATKTKLIGDMLPGMNEIAAAMREAAKEGGLWLIVLVGIGGAIDKLLGFNEMEKAVNKVSDLRMKMAWLEEKTKSGAVMRWLYGRDFETELAKAKIDLDKAMEALRVLRNPALAAPGTTGPVAGADTAAANAAKFLDDGKAAKEAAAREQAIRDAIHKVRIEDDARANAQVEAINKRNEDAAAAEVAREQEIRDIKHRVREEDDARALAQIKAFTDQEIAIQKYKNAVVYAMEASTWQAAAGLLQEFAGESKAAAIAVIAIQKGLAIAQVVMNTQVAVMRGYAELGPYAGTANAARMETLGAIQIGLIAAAGVMQASNVGSRGAAPGTPANPISVSGPSPVGAGGAGQQQQRGPDTFIQIRGDDIFSGRTLATLAEKLNEFSRDGGRVVVVAS